jgi:hypothetical protein
MLSVFFLCVRNRSLTSREEDILQMFENKVLIYIYGSMMDDLMSNLGYCMMRNFVTYTDHLVLSQ